MDPHWIRAEMQLDGTSKAQCCAGEKETVVAVKDADLLAISVLRPYVQKAAAARQKEVEQLIANYAAELAELEALRGGGK